MNAQEVTDRMAGANPKSEVMVIVKVQTSEGTVEQQCSVTEVLVSAYQDAPVVIYAEPMMPAGNGDRS